MKILLITFSDNPDHQDITIGMYEQLRNREDVWLLCTDEPKVSIEYVSKCKQISCPKRPGICKKTFDIQTLFQTMKWIRKENFDVIFFESLHVWNLPILLFNKRKVKTFQMIHDLIPHHGDKQEKMVSLMNRVVSKLADRIVLCNKKYFHDAINMYGMKEECVSCIDMWRRFPAYVEHPRTKKVLFFGRLNPYKGLELLQDIVENCPDVSFEIVGRADEQVKDLVEQLRSASNVNLHDSYVTEEEMTETFCKCDWVILPYKSATQSGVIIDAYRHGKPVIAFDVGAISEQVCDGQSGFLIPEEDTQQFATKIKECQKIDEETYRRLSRVAYEFGYKKYAVECAADRFIELIVK